MFNGDIGVERLKTDRKCFEQIKKGRKPERKLRKCNEMSQN